MWKLHKILFLDFFLDHALSKDLQNQWSIDFRFMSVTLSADSLSKEDRR